MEFNPLFVVIPVVVCFIIGGYLLDKKRKAAIRKALGELNFNPQEGAYSLADFPFAPLQVFNVGRSRRMHNVATAKLGSYDLRYFEFIYVSGSGKNRRTCFRSCLLLSGALKFPSFTLAKENWLSKIAQAAGYQDIDFDLNPEFSKAFVIRGKSENEIKQLFTPSVQNSLIKNANINLEGEGENLVFFTEKKISAKNFKGWIEEGKQVLRLFARS